MNIPGFRIWIVFYAIAIIILIWAILVSVKGVMIFVCLILILLVVGISFVTVNNQIKKHKARSEMQRQLVEGFARSSPEEDQTKK